MAKIDWVESILQQWGRESVRGESAYMASISGIAIENNKTETRTGVSPSRYLCISCRQQFKCYVKRCPICESEDIEKTPYLVTANGKHSRVVTVRTPYVPDYVTIINAELEDAAKDLRKLAELTYVKTLPTEAICKTMNIGDTMRRDRLGDLHHYLSPSLRRFRYLSTG